MSEKPTLTDQENALVERLIFLNNEIKRLEVDRDAIQRQIDEVRKSNTSIKDIKRINSVNKVIAENLIYQIIKSATVPVKTSTIEVNLRAKFLGVKSSTFRSYLKRMHTQGRIVPHAHGYWKLPKK